MTRQLEGVRVLKCTAWVDNRGRGYAAIELPYDPTDPAIVRATVATAERAALEGIRLELEREGLTLETLEGGRRRPATVPTIEPATGGYGPVGYWPYHTATGGPTVVYRFQETHARW